MGMFWRGFSFGFGDGWMDVVDVMKGREVGRDEKERERGMDRRF